MKDGQRLEPVFLDIETGPKPLEEREGFRPTMETMSFGNTKDPKKKEAKLQEAIEVFESGEKAAVDVMQADILCLGYCDANGDYAVIEGEASCVEKYIKLATEAVTGLGCLVGHNIIRFDARMLLRKAQLLGIYFPRKVMEDATQYTPKHMVDTMRLWNWGEKNEFTRLEVMCKALGIPVKEGEVEGKDFHKFYKSTPLDKEKAMAYLKQDVMALREACAKIAPYLFDEHQLAAIKGDDSGAECPF